MKNKNNNLIEQKKNHHSNNISFLNTEIFSENSEMKNILGMMDKLLHWAAIIDSSDDAIISKSIEGYITSWNRGAQRLYGYTPDEIIGKPVSVLMPPEREDDFPFIMTQLQQGKKVEHYETRRRTKDGKVIDVSITVSPIKDSHGTIIGASKIARDISDRVENEKRREEFVSIASHELKTPLTSQKAFGELLERLIDKNGHTEYKPYIQKINVQTNKLTKLIEDLLELSRVQTGRLKMESKLFNFDKLIEEIIETMQMTTKHKLVLKGHTDKKIKGDTERMGQVLTNYLSNAIKYSPKAEKVVIFSKVDGDFVTVGVQDFGIGISKENHQKIFERFFRVTGIDEKTFPGMGIGLHVCQEIIARHGGKTWVQSEKGRGATFYFSVPYK